METEADEVGLKLASKACFDVRAAPVFWAKMNALSHSDLKDNIEPPEFLSTHPSHESRYYGFFRIRLNVFFKKKTPSAFWPKLHITAIFNIHIFIYFSQT